MHACIAMIACPEEIEPDLPGFVVLSKGQRQPDLRRDESHPKYNKVSNSVWPTLDGEVVQWYMDGRWMYVRARR
jgi:hypothetical protein